MATPLGTSFSDEEVVAQSDVHLAGTMVETLVVEFDQAKYEEALSSGYLSPKAMRKIHKISKEIKAPTAPITAECSNQRELRVCEPEHELCVSTLERKSRVHEPKQALRMNQTKRSSQERVIQTKRSPQERVNQPKRSPQECVIQAERSPQVCVIQPKRSPQECIIQAQRRDQGSATEPKRNPQGCVLKLKCRPQKYVDQSERNPQRCVPTLKRNPQGYVSQIKRSLQRRVPAPKRNPQGHVSPTERNSQECVPELKSRSQGCVSSSKRRIRSCVNQAKHDPRVPSSERDVIRRVQKDQHGFKVHVCQEPVSFTDGQGVPSLPSRSVRGLSQVFDLWELLSRGKPIQQVVHSCQCKRLISAVLSRCQDCSHAAKPAVFSRQMNVALPNQYKRRRSQKKTTSEDEYLGVTTNMIGRGKLSIPSPNESEEDQSPGLKDHLDRSDGIYQHTRTQKGVIPPVDYRKLAKGIRSDDEHSAIADSQSSSSFEEHESFAYMTGHHDDLVKRLDEQQVMLESQQEVINELRILLNQLVADRAKPQKTDSPPRQEPSRRRRASSSRPHTSKRKGKGFDDAASDQEAHNLESSSDEGRETENEQNLQSIKMEELEARLNVMANRSELQDEGVVRPYPAEWDAAPYPPKFKVPMLQTFDGTGSPNQHIYHFKSQTGNVISNDAILARLFIGTLKGVAFEWFMKLPAGCIQKWADLERLFLSRFFEDDTEVSIHTLLATKQKKEEPVKAFVDRFRSMALRCPTGMTQSTLVETCRHNLQTQLLAQMRVAECRAWRQLISQGEKAQEIVARIKADKQYQPEQWDQAQSSQSEGEDITATEANYF